MSLDFADLPPEIAAKRVLPSNKAAAFAGYSPREWKRKRAAGETPDPVRLGVRRLGYTIESLILMTTANTERGAAK